MSIFWCSWWYSDYPCAMTSVHVWPKKGGEVLTWLCLIPSIIVWVAYLTLCENVQFPLLNKTSFKSCSPLKACIALPYITASGDICSSLPARKQQLGLRHHLLAPPSPGPEQPWGFLNRGHIVYTVQRPLPLLSLLSKSSIIYRHQREHHLARITSYLCNTADCSFCIHSQDTR